MKKQIKLISISLILMVLVIGGLVWIGNKKEFQPATVGGFFGGTLTVKENFYDFGSVKINGGFANHEYVLENASDKIVKIGEVSTSCMCTTTQVMIGNKTYGPFGMPGHLGASKVNAVVNPGEKMVVKATFDPAAHGPTGIGMIERQIFVNIGAEQSLVLEFKANVIL